MYRKWRSRDSRWAEQRTTTCRSSSKTGNRSSCRQMSAAMARLLVVFVFVFVSVLALITGSRGLRQRWRRISVDVRSVYLQRVRSGERMTSRWCHEGKARRCAQEVRMPPSPDATYSRGNNVYRSASGHSVDGRRLGRDGMGSRKKPVHPTEVALE